MRLKYYVHAQHMPEIIKSMLSMRCMVGFAENTVNQKHAS